MEKLAERIGIGTILFCLAVICLRYFHVDLIGFAWPKAPIFILLVILGPVVYFMPTYLARKKKDSTVVFLINLAFGWTFLGWFVALIWAMKSAPKGDNTERIRDPKTGRFLSGIPISIFLCLLLLIPAASFAQRRFVPLDISIYPVLAPGEYTDRTTPYPMIEAGQAFDLELAALLPYTEVGHFRINDIVVLISNLAGTKTYYKQIFYIGNGGMGLFITTLNIIPPDNLCLGASHAKVYELIVKYRVSGPNGNFVKSQTSKFVCADGYW